MYIIILHLWHTSSRFVVIHHLWFTLLRFIRCFRLYSKSWNSLYFILLDASNDMNPYSSDLRYLRLLNSSLYFDLTRIRAIVFRTTTYLTCKVPVIQIALVRDVKDLGNFKIQNFYISTFLLQLRFKFTYKACIWIHRRSHLTPSHDIKINNFEVLKVPPVPFKIWVNLHFESKQKFEIRDSWCVPNQPSIKFWAIFVHTCGKWVGEILQKIYQTIQIVWNVNE